MSKDRIIETVKKMVKILVIDSLEFNFKILVNINNNFDNI